MTTLTGRETAAPAVPVEVAAALYRNLAAPTRHQLVLALMDGERRVVDLVAEMARRSRL